MPPQNPRFFGESYAHIVLALPKYAIGKALFQAKVYIETTEVFAWILVIVLLSEACEKMMALLLKKGGTRD